MNDTEELLRLTLQRHAEQAPAFTGLTPAGSPRRRWTWLIPTLVAGVTATVVLGVVWLDGRDTTVESGPAGTTPFESVADLTGEDVGLALGLEPMHGTVHGCRAYAEYDNNAGFCLDEVTHDRFEVMVLAKQLQGYVRDQYLLEYARTWIAWEAAEEAMDAGPVTQTERLEADRLRADVDQLADQLTKAPTDPKASGSSDQVEAEFHARADLPSCGAINTLRSEQVWQDMNDGLQCLQHADPTAGAELAVVSYTPEGDPIRTFYRKEPGREGYQVYIDTTADNLGPQRWLLDSCDDLSLQDDDAFLANIISCHR